MSGSTTLKIDRTDQERAFPSLLDKKMERYGKGMEIDHNRLEMQNYTQSEDIDNNNKKGNQYFNKQQECI